MALIKLNNRSSEDTAIHGRRNLIINGAMQVAQRGTSYTQSNPNAGNYHTVDRYSYRRSGTWSGVTAVELTQESSGGPVGFKNFLRYAPTGSDATTPDNACMLVDYKLEGQDISQLEWGTSNAKTITISFYVRSSVTGTFCLNIRNTSPTRQYVKEYTINSANTWERKELTFPGDTSGTWAEDNGTGLGLMWFLSGHTDSPSESGRLVTGNQWNTTATTNTYTSNQSDALTTTSGNTFDITGLQLEVGDIATPFEHRSYAEELALCQRYFHKIGNTGTDYFRYCVVHCDNATNSRGIYNLPVPMRTLPTLNTSGAFQIYSAGSLTDTLTISLSPSYTSVTGEYVSIPFFSTVSGGQTAGNSGALLAKNQSTHITLDSEL